MHKSRDCKASVRLDRGYSKTGNAPGGGRSQESYRCASHGWGGTYWCSAAISCAGSKSVPIGIIPAHPKIKKARHQYSV